MKNNITICFLAFGITFFNFSCDSDSEAKQTAESETVAESMNSPDPSPDFLFLSDYKFDNLGIKVDTLPSRSLTGAVHANGELVVSPQYEATVAPIMGGNIEAIGVIEGDRVTKGQVLAYITHPDFTKLQADYLRTFSQLEFLQQEFDRQQRLYEEEVGSGKSFQKTKSELNILQVELKGYEAQLRQLNLDPEKIREEKIYDKIPVLSPISGFVEKIWVQIGQYVQPETSMMSIINIDHIHADLMVFEKDIAKIKVGQSVSLTLESNPGEELKGKIYSIGKVFEKNTKAVHVHANIERGNHQLLPGMYIHGKIHSSQENRLALPEEAVIEEEGRSFIFLAQKTENTDRSGWIFEPIEIRKGMMAEDWVEIRALQPLSSDSKVVWNGAYYLISEMKKGEFEED